MYQNIDEIEWNEYIHETKNTYNISYDIEFLEKSKKNVEQKTVSFSCEDIEEFVCKCTVFMQKEHHFVQEFIEKHEIILNIYNLFVLMQSNG